MTDNARAWGWVAHLRDGGTTRWRSWTGEADETLGRRVPGAQRLEVLRRLNELGPVPTLLADSVLTTTALGRGQQERRLEGGGPEEPFGAPRVAPIELPLGELRRVATGALADLTRRATVPPAPRAPRLARWRRTPVRLVGDPLLAASYADQLAGRGRPPGGRHPEVAVLAAPLDLAVFDVWAHRVLTGGRVRWLPWLERFTGRHRLPEAADPSLVAARWAGRVGRDRVHLCGSPDGLAELIGVRLATPERLSHPALEAVRATSSMLHLAVPADRLPTVLAGVLVPWIAAGDAGHPPGGWVPPPAREWLAGQTERIRAGLRTAGYPVHGDGAGVAAEASGAPERLTDAAVLEIVLAALHRAGRDVVQQEGAR